ncbi:MAG: hypothetical protein ACI4VQ_02340 [Clostridia bacterium]
MTDLEILAELKQAYLLLEDIEENQTKQITENEGKYIILSMQNLEILYRNIYKRIVLENNNSLYYANNIKIGYAIYIDYTNEDCDFKEVISYTDLDNEAKWWEDYNFLI